MVVIPHQGPGAFLAPGPFVFVYRSPTRYEFPCSAKEVAHDSVSDDSSEPSMTS